MNLPEPIVPISMTVQAATRYSGLSKTTIFKLIRQGHLASAMVMNRRLIVRSSLDDLILNGER